MGNKSDPVYKQNFSELKYDKEIDASNCCVLPGLIDSHTHPIWEGDRINEFKMKVLHED